MYQEFYANHHLMIYPMIGLCIFFISFLLVLAWVFFGLRGNPTVEEMAALLLVDDCGTTASVEESHE